VLAYAGLRPGEALGLRWSDIRQGTLLIERSASLGELKTTKTRRIRSVTLLGPLAIDLRELQLALGRPAEDLLVFARSDGTCWTQNDWNNWRKRRFSSAARAVGIQGLTPYELRHSFCSLLIHEGMNPVEVAAQAGHAPSMSLDTYGHIFAELRGSGTRSAEDLIPRRAQ
jgi:integrase